MLHMSKRRQASYRVAPFFRWVVSSRVRVTVRVRARVTVRVVVRLAEQKKEVATD